MRRSKPGSPPPKLKIDEYGVHITTPVLSGTGNTKVMDDGNGNFYICAEGTIDNDPNYGYPDEVWGEIIQNDPNPNSPPSGNATQGCIGGVVGGGQKKWCIKRGAAPNNDIPGVTCGPARNPVTNKLGLWFKYDGNPPFWLVVSRDFDGVCDSDTECNNTGC